MKQKFLLSAVFSVITILATISCVKENRFEISSEEVKFRSNITTADQTAKATDNAWNAKDSIGIYMFKKSSFNIADGGENIPYVARIGGTDVSFAAKDQAIYFPDNGSEVRFMSYFPYNSEIVPNIYKVDVSDQSNQSAIDLLYSFDQEAFYVKDSQNKMVYLNFDHKLSKIVINIKTGTGHEYVDLENLKILISGLNTKADFDLINGRLNNRSAIAGIVPVNVSVKDDFHSSYEAIVIPTEITPTDAKIVFDLNNGEEINNDMFTWILGSPLLGSYKYTFNVTINRSGIIVLGLISDWSDGESDINAE